MTWLQWLGFGGLFAIAVSVMVYCQVNYPERDRENPDKVDPYNFP